MNSSSSILTILGSCSGTEPHPDRHHTSITIEHEGNLYWLDTGETCSYTAHVMGLDISRTMAIFLTHTHMDHIGGLPNLLWTLRKLSNVNPECMRNLQNREIPVFMPDTDPFEGVMAILRKTEGDFASKFSVKSVKYTDGEIYRNGDFSLQALHNFHMETSPPWRSYSFRSKVGSKTVTFSGDCRHISDIAPLLDGSDYLLVETGHHSVESICDYLVAEKVDFGRLVFTHHGRAILSDPDYELRKAQSIVGDRVAIAFDRMQIDLSDSV